MSVRRAVSASRGSALRVAVAEDDKQLREDILLPGLRDFGFDAVGFGSASDLYRGMLAAPFDFVVVDIGLPDESGLNVVRHLREISSGLGLVVLTASHGRSNHLRALAEGADAYLPKPVDCEILAVTLRSVARRMAQGAEEPVMRPVEGPSEWRLTDDAWCLLSPSGGMLALTTPERSLMRALDTVRGQPVDRENLVAVLAKETSDFDPHRLEMLVHRLRRKAASLSPDGVPFPLLAVRGIGYLFAGQGR